MICRSNHYGHFLEILEFHSGSCQGVIRIPEGKASKGWLDFALVCQGFCDKHIPLREVDGDCDRRRGVSTAVGSNQGKEHGVLRISPTDTVFENHVTVAVNHALGDLDKIAGEGNMESEVNARVDILLNLTLVRGPGGKWAVTQAQILKPKAPV